jgi:Uma2 family endonuclease
MGDVAIPGWVVDLPSYRRWAHSDDYPESGWVSFLDGQILVDLSMEEFITHNRVRTAYTYRIVDVLSHDPRGDFVSDRMLLTNPAANLSTEPDGLFFLWTTMQTGKLRLVPGKTSGYMELEGTPDMTLEIVSKTSQRKDKELLRELYWKAGVTEYWLVDARDDQMSFDILVHTPAGYVASPINDGWVKSNVLGREFRLVKHTDPLGNPRFVVEVR